MQQMQSGSEERQADNQPDFETYLPGMPRVSSQPGLVERSLTRLFRRRGDYSVRVRSE